MSAPSPRAWWVAAYGAPEHGAVWTHEPTAGDLQWLRDSTGMLAVVTELGNVADARRQALEDAARACEHFAAQGPDHAKAEPLRDMAALIRALIAEPIPTGEAQESDFGAFEDAQGKKG